jgi:hypothetical protein
MGLVILRKEAPSEQMSVAIAAMASGRGPGEDRLRPSLCPAAKILFSRGAHDFVRFGRDAEPPQQARQLPTLAVCAVLGLFAACVQRL